MACKDIYLDFDFIISYSCKGDFLFLGVRTYLIP